MKVLSGINNIITIVGFAWFAKVIGDRLREVFSKDPLPGDKE